jgi:YHS domain-containing protein
MFMMLRFLRPVFVLVLLGITIYVLYKVLWKGEWFPTLFSSKPKKKGNHPQSEVVGMQRDPICGTFIPETHAIKYKKGKEIQYFCSEECKARFLDLRKKKK